MISQEGKAGDDMDILENAKQLAKGTGELVSRKAAQVKEVLLLKSRVDTCEEMLEKYYRELGKLYFETHGQEPEEIFEKHCRHIANAKRGKEELTEILRQAEAQLKEM
ncbi:MAG: hypothetical protein IJ335_07690 [Lachnospiraceae bacterium]|nr:hypothetical protein [Lachnospiraceae bacterium]